MRATLSLTTVISLVHWLVVPTAVVYRSAREKLRFLAEQAPALAAPAAMAVTDFFVGEISVEVIKLLLSLASRSTFYKSIAGKLRSTLEELTPIVKEIMYSGNELPQDRQRQLYQLYADMNSAKELCQKLMKSSRWSLYKNLVATKKLEKIDKKLTKFIQKNMQLHMAADISHTRFAVSEVNVIVNQLDGSVKRLESEISQMKIGSGGWVEEAMRQREESELWQSSSSSVPNVGVALEMGKIKVREMLIGREDSIVTIHGIGGSGKTTLANETSKDPQVKDYFNGRILFLTVSQSPNLDDLKARIWGFIMGNDGFNSFSPMPAWNLQHKWGQGTQRYLIVLDDVWSLSDLDPLLALTRAPGCKTLVVSRNHFETISKVSYEMELLRDHEAMTLFCLHAFDQKSVLPTFDENLVKQIVNECKGLPLALKVIGSGLRDQPEMYWLNAKNRLSRGEPISEHGSRLLESMKMSTDHLNKKVRECFKDLGAFPEDQRIPLDIIINMWVELHDLGQEEAFAILVELSNKNLVSLVKDARVGEVYSSYYDVYVTQHDVLRDLALYLNSQEEDINARSRLIMPKREREIPREWERNSDQPFNARIVSINTDEMQEMDMPQLDFPKLDVLILNLHSSNYFLPPFIEHMSKLRALIIINHSSTTALLRNTSVLAHLPNLRTLWLEKVVVPSLSTPYKKMRKLSFILCKVNDSLDPSLTDLPSLFPNLIDLTIDHCDDLVELPSSICSMGFLQSLSITNCHSLKKLPVAIDGLTKLEILRTYACPNLKSLPSGFCKLFCLKYLDISQCVNLMELPKGVGELGRLEKIDMRECSNLSSLPKSAVSLRSLRWVICDEDVSHIWRDFVQARPSVHLQVVEKCFTLDWLD